MQLKKQRIVDIEMVDFFLENENCKKLPPSPRIKFGLSLICVIKVFSLLDKKWSVGIFCCPMNWIWWWVPTTHHQISRKWLLYFLNLKNNFMSGVCDSHVHSKPPLVLWYVEITLTIWKQFRENYSSLRTKKEQKKSITHQSQVTSTPRGKISTYYLSKTNIAWLEWK